MYRRIDIISNLTGTQDTITGLMSISPTNVVDAWAYDLRGPYGKRSDKIPQNAKFYFTEKGWKEVGRKVITELQKAGWNYRIIKVKHNELNVVWKDEYTGYEVAGQYRKNVRKNSSNRKS